MLTRIVNKLRRLRRNKLIASTPMVEGATYIELGNQWYEPLLAGPSTLLPYVVGGRVVRSVLEILDRLSPDKYIEFLTNFYRAGLNQYGDSWIYADINTVLYGLAKKLAVESYMEIGVRRGRSMAMVAAQQPESYIAGFDLWIPNYCGIENPGTIFVQAELKNVGFNGTAEFINGDSKVTVKQYFKKNKTRYFDLITIDGDHSLRGARTDLGVAVSRLKIGGALVFDDLCSPEHRYLEGLWNDLIVTNDRYAAYSFTEIGYGIGFAIKRY